MNQHPKRLLDSPSVSPEAKELLRAYPKTPGLPPELSAHVQANLPQGAPAPWTPVVIKGSLVVLGALALGTALLWRQPEDPLAQAPIAHAPAIAQQRLIPPALEPGPGKEIPEGGPSPKSTLAKKAEAPVDVSEPAESEMNAADRLAAELRILDAAKAGLPRDPAVTLHHTRRHAQRFPEGQLADLRLLLEVRAHRAMGQKDEAETLRERFLSIYPNSALRKELEP